MKKAKITMLLILTCSMLLGCNGHGGGEEPIQDHPVTVLGFEAMETASIQVTTDLDEAKEIHTEAQKNYLSYNGDYSKIDPDLYPNGLQHLSDPLPVKLEWEHEVPEDKELVRYSVVYGQEEDLIDGYEVKGTKETSLDVYNSYLGDNYFRVLARYSDNSVDCTPIMSYFVDGTYPRNLKIDGMTNCRDMGGRVLDEGGKIKQGLLYRTSATNSWGNGNAVIPDNITDAGKEELLNHLGVKTEIDVNNSGSNRVGVQNYVPAYMYYDGGKHHLFRNTEPLKVFFAALAEEENYPVFYHCRIGTDRTGLCAIMISGLLGLPENEIYKDYLFSNFGNIQEKRYIGEKAGRDNIQTYIEDIKLMPGATFKNKVYNLLLSIGVTKQQLDSIINILTEGNKASGNDNGQVVVTADKFTASGTSKKTSSNTAHPATYYTLGKDQSVTASLEVKKTGTATVVAYLGSTSSNSTKISASISATVNGNALTVTDKTFQEAGFGTGANRTYYAPVMLGTVDLTAGNSTIQITGIANNLNIGAISLIYA